MREGTETKRIFINLVNAGAAYSNLTFDHDAIGPQESHLHAYDGKAVKGAAHGPLRSNHVSSLIKVGIVFPYKSSYSTVCVS